MISLRGSSEVGLHRLPDYRRHLLASKCSSASSPVKPEKVLAGDFIKAGSESGGGSVPGSIQTNPPSAGSGTCGSISGVSVVLFEVAGFYCLVQLFQLVL